MRFVEGIPGFSVLPADATLLQIVLTVGAQLFVTERVNGQSALSAKVEGHWIVIDAKEGDDITYILTEPSAFIHKLLGLICTDQIMK